jgi:hypothetical protein
MHAAVLRRDTCSTMRWSPRDPIALAVLVIGIGMVRAFDPLYPPRAQFPAAIVFGLLSPLGRRRRCITRSLNAIDEAVLDRLIAAGEDDWNRRGRWREALKDGLVGSLRSKALALND